MLGPSEAGRGADALNWVWAGLLGVGSVALLVVGAAGFVLYPQVLRRPPIATYPMLRTAEEANLQDLDYLARVMEVDRSFSPEAKAAFGAGSADLMGWAYGLSRARRDILSALRIARAAD